MLLLSLLDRINWERTELNTYKLSGIQISSSIFEGMYGVHSCFVGYTTQLMILYAEFFAKCLLMQCKMYKFHINIHKSCISYASAAPLTALGTYNFIYSYLYNTIKNKRCWHERWKRFLKLMCSCNMFPT